MASAEDLLEELLEKQLELVRAKRGSEREQLLEKRIGELEARFEAKPKDEQEDAIEELTDEEWELVKTHRAAAAKPPKPKEPAKEPKAKEDEPKRRPRQRLTPQIPRIWSGDDEPDHVEYEDEDGKTKVRPGRKKGQPYEWQVDDLKPAGDDDAGDAA